MPEPIRPVNQQEDSAIALARRPSPVGAPTPGRALDPGGDPVFGHRRGTALVQHLDLTCLDQFPEGGALQDIVMHLTTTGGSQVERPTARESNLDRSA